MNRLEKRQLKPHWLQRRRRLMGGSIEGFDITDAPQDGETYGRQNGAWVEVVEEAPVDGTLYGRQNETWQPITGGGGGTAASGITFAPVGNIAATNVQAAIQELDTEKVSKAGDTMTGNLTITRTDATFILNKTTVANSALLAGRISGGNRWVMALGTGTTHDFTLTPFDDSSVAQPIALTILRSTGLATVKGNPTDPLGIVTKQYADALTIAGSAGSITNTPAGNIVATTVQAAINELDTEKVAKAGDTMTGALTLANGTVAAPSINFAAGTAYGFYWVGSAFGVAVGGANKFTFAPTVNTSAVPIALPADPASNLHAATKQYVDNKVQLGGAEISDTAPTAAQGKLWWESDAGGLWLSYNDGNTTQWIGVGGNVAQGNYVSKAGDTITGNISITSPTASGTPTSGALVVTGGVGIGGALNIAGAVNNNSTTQLGDTLTLFSASPEIILDRPTITNSNILRGKVAGLSKWAIILGNNGAMSGGNTGADFTINRYADTTGAFLDNSVVIYRDNGRVALASNTASTSSTTGALTVNGGVGVGGRINTAGDLTITKTLPTITLNKAASGDGNFIIGQKGGLNRWVMRFGGENPESGSNVGSEFSLSRYNDAGASLGVILSIERSNGAMYISSTVASTSPTTGALVVSGGVGIGTGLCVGASTLNGPLVALGYNGSVNTSGAISTNNTHAGSVGSNLMVFYRNSTITGSIDQTDTTTAYRTTSDARMKDDLRSFDAGIIIDRTEVYDFRWKSSGKRAHGVMAQEAIEVYPEAAYHDEKLDWWSTDYSKYVPVMLQELKSLRSRVAELEVR